MLVLALAGTSLAAESAAGSALSKDNVFRPPGSAAAASAAANETLEFAGVSSIGSRTELIFYDKATKKNHWIGKGETKEGITVLNYDARREEAIVTINGTQKTLPMRQPAAGKPGAPIRALPPVATGFNVSTPAPLPTVVTPAAAPVTPTPDAAPMPAPPNTPPPAPTTPEAVAKAETEARMLVSDLLEIGMAQRRAYEEAQRRAAEGNANPPNPAPPAPPKQ